MITIEHSRDTDMIVLRASGVLTTKDYDAAVPELEHALDLAKAPLRVLIRLEDFQGWDIGALWRELEVDFRHRRDRRNRPRKMGHPAVRAFREIRNEILSR